MVRDENSLASNPSTRYVYDLYYTMQRTTMAALNPETSDLLSNLQAIFLWYERKLYVSFCIVTCGNIIDSIACRCAEHF